MGPTHQCVKRKSENGEYVGVRCLIGIVIFMKRQIDSQIENRKWSRLEILLDFEGKE